MADLLALSARIIDSGVADEPVNRVTGELSEVSTNIAIVESFSHSVVLRTDDGLVCFDTSGVKAGEKVVESIRRWSPDRFQSLIYTHGHADHIGGSGAFMADARAKGHGKPRVIAHEAVPTRIDRYNMTNGYNMTINARQFGGGITRNLGLSVGSEGRFLPNDVARPEVTFDYALVAEVGGATIEMHHDKGETDDHLWAWLPEHKALVTGDFLIWNFPNAGNPQKVQRYPSEWAHALRKMAAMEAELLLPAHGLPIAGKERIAMVLGDVASALEYLVSETLAMMNAGEPLDAIIHSVKLNPDTLAKPYLRPMYDEPEFVIRNIWRLYGGWYDGNPAHLKPAAQGVLAAEIVNLVGGAKALAVRAKELADASDYRLACELIELAVTAEGDNRFAHEIRAEIYLARRKAETSTMAKGIYRWAAQQSQGVIRG